MIDGCIVDKLTVPSGLSVVGLGNSLMITLTVSSLAYGVAGGAIPGITPVAGINVALLVVVSYLITPNKSPRLPPLLNLNFRCQFRRS